METKTRTKKELMVLAVSDGLFVVVTSVMRGERN